MTLRLIGLCSVAVALALMGCEVEPTDAAPATTDTAGGDTPCGDTTSGDTGIASGLTSLAKTSSEGVEIELLAAHPLSVGWQQVFYRVTHAGKAVTEATLVQKPVMKMMSMQHACPVVQPAATAGSDGLFAGELLFQMASNPSEAWNLEADVTPAGGALKTLALGKLEVAAAPFAKTLMVGTGMAAERYTVIVHFPVAPKVGLNDYRVALHKVSADMMTFTPVSDATLKGTPEMPSMGHGSPNNVDPMHQADGYYAGKVNFTMPGDWRMTVAISLAGKSLGNAVFDWEL